MSKQVTLANAVWELLPIGGDHSIEAAAAGGDDRWCVSYWLQACASKSPNTRRAYQREAHRWLAFLTDLRADLCGGYLLRSATYEDVARFVKWIQDDSMLSLSEASATTWARAVSGPRARRR